MGQTQIPVDEETRERLRWVKQLSVSDSYSETIEALIEEAGFDVPDEELTEESFKRVVMRDD